MAVPFKVRIGDLLPEFPADTFIVLAALQAAGTVPTRALESVADHLHHFFIFIQSDSHRDHFLPTSLYLLLPFCQESP